ncbi:MAG: SDR family NAD(P)-dependent oxidoreductase [Candidatus Aminicenantes bacterium]|nr:MAG: SDR family NAD(P)-dependent oxidoreductase [Candidatus Aminicenantes bacterium]
MKPSLTREQVFEMVSRGKISSQQGYRLFKRLQQESLESPGVPFLPDPAPPLAVEDSPGDRPPEPGKRKQTNILPADRVRADIKRIAAGVLKINHQKLDIHESLGNYGFDSISLKEFANQLSKIYQVEILPAVFFRHGSIGSLSEYFMEEWQAEMSRYYSGTAGVPIADTRAENQAGKNAGAVPGAANLAKGHERPARVKLSREQAGEKQEIAIIGASGILPGSKNLAEFWQHLQAGKDLITEVPPDRWDWREYYSKYEAETNRVISKWGGFIPDVDKFDARFFNISPREAEMMDPQQRLLVETVWKTIEDAGYQVSALSGKSVGVFIGADSVDYLELVGSTSGINAQMATSTHHAVLANRVSFLLNWRGASETINTGCSSSLVAMNQAIRAIQAGDCEMAVVGGVNIMISPAYTIGASLMGVLSPDGRCKTFDKRANGYVRGEGVISILLKPLNKAIAHHDYIYAVIKGTAVNHGGKANSLTAPNSDAQAALLVSAYEEAGIDPETVTYIEAHGTGTELGDPVEIEGIKQAFNQLAKKRKKTIQRNYYCGLGTVKTNIGHLEPAAGIAGIIKVLLAMKHKVLPGVLHLQKLNPYIRLRHTPFYVVEKTRPWKALKDGSGNSLPRRAGVSSFGFGGTNAHVVLEEYVHPEPQPQAGIQDQEPHLIILSATNRERLKEYARNMVTFLDKHMCGPDRDHTKSSSMEPGRAGEFQTEVQEDLLKEASLVLAVHDQDMDINEEFMDCGFDAPHFQEMAGRINERYRLDINPGVFFTYLSIGSLARYLCNRYAEAVKAYYLSRGGDSPHPAGTASPAAASVPSSLRLGDIAYTLQLGREPMDERIALIVSSSKELKEKLIHYCQEESSQENVYTGNVKANRQTAQLLGEGEESESYITTILQSGKLDKIARLWISGVGIPWELLYPNQLPLRISLPTYPFARERHWVCPPPLPGNEVEVKESPVTDQPVNLYYQEVWEKSTVSQNRPGHQLLLSGSGILVFDINPKVRDALISALNKNNRDNIPVILVQPGNHFQDHGSGIYEINPEDPTHYRQLMETLVEQDQAPDRMIHLWSREVEADGNESLARQVKKSFYSLLYLTQALMTMSAAVKKRYQLLYIYPGSGDTLQPQYAGISGFARTLRIENPGFIYKAMAMPVTFNEPLEISWLLEVAGDEFAAADDEPDIRFDEERQRYVSRLKELEVKGKEEPLTLKEKGVYLITGGLGGLGLIIAGYLARKVKARLVLTGRSAPGADKQASIRHLESLGAEVIYIQADASNRQEAEHLVTRVKHRYNQLNGIFHSAGVIRDSFIMKKTPGEAEAVLAPKVYGAVHLDEVTREENLDFFIMFSSLAAVLGNAGQCDYAYANAFMDRFAQWREQQRNQQERSGRTVSINWPLWQEGGMQLSDEDRAILSELTGAPGMPTNEGLHALERVLECNLTQCIVVHGSPDRIKPIMARGYTFQPAPSVTAPGPPPSTIDPEELAEKTRGFLKQMLGKILKLSPDQIEPEVSFEEYGIDSIVINMFNVEVERGLCSIPKTLLFEYRNLQQLTAYFVAHHQVDLVKRFNIEESQPPAAQIRRSKPEPAKPLTPSAGKIPLQQETIIIPDEASSSPETRGEIAIIGVSGRYPMARNLEEYWENLKHGRDCITEIPTSRWDHRDYYDPGTGTGKMYSKWGGFLEDIDVFDPIIFNISPREAEMIDPQERIFLEAAWEAVEDAGYTREEIKRYTCEKNGVDGGDVGVFTGVTTYSYYMFGPGGNLELALSNPWSIANRVSFVFDVHGPSMPVDTACSASLTAVHLACASLEKGECRMAIAGGVNLYLHPSKYLSLCSMQMLSPTGRCRTFGGGSDGFVPGEGVGAVLLKPLPTALRDKDHIYAVIKGSSINHGGRTNGYTVPNPNAQASLIGQTLKNANINPRTISYVEAHGTGTSLGDPVEIQGLIKAYEKYTREKQYCPIGSVKSNIGHLESAAGIAGLTKIILQMKHRQLVPSLHARTLNPNIDFETSPFYVQQELSEWKQPVIKVDGEERRYPIRAAISSFGAGGANAHVILEEAPADRQQTTEDREYLILLSTKNEERLKEYARKLEEFLENQENTNENQGNISPGDMAYTLQVGREAMNQRLALVISNMEELKEKLSQYVQGEPGIENLFTGSTKTDKKTLERVLKGKTGEEFINNLLKQRDLPRLARLWVSGLAIDWRLLYPGETPCRISLPTYPFARKRCWKSQTTETSHLPGEKAQLHPLLDGIDPGKSLEYPNSLVFQKTFRETDWVLGHHQVMGRCILPGVAYIEMAHAAFSQTRQPGTFNIHRLVLLQPLAVQNEPRQVMIVIEKYNSQYRFQVRSETHQQAITHARGEFRIHDIPAADKDQPLSRLPIEAIKSRCTVQVDGKELYSAFLGVGLCYGLNLQGVKQILANAEAAEALGVLSLPPGYKTGRHRHQYTLHPSLMDGSLQTIAGLISCHTRHNTPRVPMLPFSFEKVEILHPLAEQGYAYVKAADSKPGHHYHVAVLDETGRVCVKLHDVTLRPVKEIAPGKSTGEVPFLYKPRWIPCPLPPESETRARETKKANLKENKAARQKVLLVYPPDTMGFEKALADAHRQSGAEVIGIPLPASTDQDPASAWESVGKPGQLHCIYFLGGIQGDTTDILDPEVLAKSQEHGVFSLFHLVKALIRRGFTREPLQIKVITNDTLRVLTREEVIPHSAALHGFVGSMAREYPRWQISCLDISLKGIKRDKPGGTEEMQHLAASIMAEPPHAPGSVVALRNRERYVQKIEPIILPTMEKTPSPFREHGVYLILGGAGGIGLELCRYLVQTMNASLILLGRSQLNEQQKQKIAQIESPGCGGEILYLQADAADPGRMAAAAAQARARFGSINGVIHSAIVLKDKTIALMDEETLREVMVPKVIGSVILYRVYQNEPLDFMMFFSSSQSFACAPGQSNYAAACTFKDAFAHYISQKVSFPVKIINWGYWGTVGIVANEYYNKRLAAQGTLSITPEEGMAVVHQVLTRRTRQVIAYKMETQVLKKMDIHPEQPVLIYPQQIPSLIDKVVPGITPWLTGLITGDSHQDQQAFAALQEFMEDLLWSVFRQMGAFQKAGEQYDKEHLKHQLKIVPGYDRLYEALLDIMSRAGLIRITENNIWTSREPKEKDPGKNLKLLENKKNRLMKQFPVIAPHIELLYTCARAYPQVLSAQVNHMEVMFPRGSLHLVENVYKGNEMSDLFNQLTARVVQAYINLRLQKNPADRIRVLEVGAGTGGTSASVLKALQEYKENIHYIYSDLSKKFVQHGEQTFAHLYPFMAFQVLDIEKDPEQQHFKPGTIDLILAVNVIHATRQITASLNQLKKLLKTNGLLLINEGTRKQDFSTMTFGLTDGWWLFQDEANRIKGSPLLSPGKWRQVLEENGFEQVQILGLPPGAEENFSQAVIIGESNGEVILEKAVVPGVKSQKSGEPAANPRPAPLIGVETAASGATSAPTTGSPDHVEEIITGILARLLHIDQSELEPDASFQDYGVDSLMAVEIIDKINEALNLDLRSTDLFNFSTLRELSHHIRKESGQEPRHTPGPGETREQQDQKATEPGEIISWEQGDTMNGAEGEPGKKYDGEDEPIAIIGMSCRFPDANDVNQFWANLAAGKNSVRQMPTNRWEIKEGGNEEKREDMQWGAFLSHIDQFDAEFFNIPDEEAEVMDPQQRLFLQEAWGAMEDAGYTEKQLKGKRCGVFVGCSSGDYAARIKEEAKNPVEYTFMGNTASILPARAAYYLNLKGPALSLDTACSSSLAALHLACESIRSGTCELAVAGGVMISTTPLFHTLAGKSGMLSPTGQCKTFDDSADGFIPGEGVGVVVLKPLPGALRERHHIYGIIKGSGMNHNGKTLGISAPSAPAQTALECEVYDRFNINPETIGYIETHGTGTPLGDPIEINGLTDAFRKYTDQKQFCAVGSVKTNIGHTLAAAGAASVIKVLLAFKYQQIPPSLNYKTPNRHINFKDSPFYVNTRLTDWQTPGGDRPRRAAVSAFGFSGTNVHLVLEEPPKGTRGLAPLPAAPLSAKQPAITRPYYFIPISAKTREALVQKYKDLLQWLNSGIKASMESIAYTLHMRRNHFSLRSALLVKDESDLKQKLRELCETGHTRDYLVNEAGAGNPKTALQQKEQKNQLIDERLHTQLPGNEYKDKLVALAELYVHGLDSEPDWKNFYQGQEVYCVSLPSYPFTGKRYWISAANQRQKPMDDENIKELIHQLELGEITVSEAESLTEGIL